MNRDDESGVLECDGSVLKYRSAIGRWEIPVTRIRLIAEYTNADGPFLDDYFFVFFTAAQDGWHEASFYAKGREDSLSVLERVIGVRLDPGLFHSTEYRTRILWPETVRDQPLMEVLPVGKQTFWQRLTDTGLRETVLSSAARRVFES